MNLDFNELYNLLREDSIVTYKMQHQLFHSPMGTKIKIWSGADAAMMLDHSLHIYGDEDTLAGFFADLEQGKEYDFFGVPAKMLPLLERALQ